MPDVTRKRLRRTTFIYWMLLFYIIAALAWWFISLEKQNKQIADLQYKSVAIEKDSLSHPGLGDKVFAIDKETKRNTRKYIAEGITFFILIMIGAAFVYRSVRRQFKLQQQQQNFMMAVTHELKTPISVAKLNLETLQKYNLDPEKQKKITAQYFRGIQVNHHRKNLTFLRCLKIACMISGTDSPTGLLKKI